MKLSVQVNVGDEDAAAFFERCNERRGLIEFLGFCPDIAEVVVEDVLSAVTTGFSVADINDFVLQQLELSKQATEFLRSRQLHAEGYAVELAATLRAEAVSFLGDLCTQVIRSPNVYGFLLG